MQDRPLHTLKDYAHWVTTLTPPRPLLQMKALKRYNTLVSTSGELLISGSDDHTLFLWLLFPSRTTSTEASELAEKGGKLKLLTRLMGHQRQVSHVAFSPNGRWAASAGWDNSLRL